MATPLTVVVVTDTAPATGGAEKVALDSAALLASAGHRVVVFYGSGQAGLESENLSFRCSGGTHLKEWASPKLKATAGIWNPATYQAMVKLLSDLDPVSTVVHAHSYMNVHTPSVLGAVQDAKYPLIITAHDYGLACPTLGFYDSTIPGVCRHRALSLGCITAGCTGTSYANKLGFVVRGFKMRRKARLPKTLKHLIAVSSGSADILRPYMPNTQVHLVPNPVDIEKPASRQRVEDNTSYGWLGRMTPEKYPSALARAAAKANVPALFVGDGPELEVTQQAYPNGEFLGQQDRAGVQAALTRFRALVMTSRWYEAAPLVIQEAHSRGIPVLVPTICAGRDAVKHGETGLHYSISDENELVDALIGLQDNHVIRAMSEAAFSQFWENPPTAQRHVSELLAVYEQAMDRHA